MKFPLLENNSHRNLRNEFSCFFVYGNFFILYLKKVWKSSTFMWFLKRKRKALGHLFMPVLWLGHNMVRQVDSLCCNYRHDEFQENVFSLLCCFRRHGYYYWQIKLRIVLTINLSLILGITGHSLTGKLKCLCVCMCVGVSAHVYGSFINSVSPQECKNCTQRRMPNCANVVLLWVELCPSKGWV